jgi:hypothetical protein
MAAPGTQENNMSRFNPDTWPDRFALERHARSLRRAETDRLARAFAEWMTTAIARLGAAVKRVSGNGAAARAH